MTILVESLKRLYNDKKIDFNKIKNLLEEGKLTQEQYEYITRKDGE